LVKKDTSLRISDETYICIDFIGLLRGKLKIKVRVEVSRYTLCAECEYNQVLITEVWKIFVKLVLKKIINKWSNSFVDCS